LRKDFHVQWTREKRKDSRVAADRGEEWFARHGTGRRSSARAADLRPSELSDERVAGSIFLASSLSST
jgi:hypothetical protein